MQHVPQGGDPWFNAPQAGGSAQQQQQQQQQQRHQQQQQQQQPGANLFAGPGTYGGSGRQEAHAGGGNGGAVNLNAGLMMQPGPASGAAAGAGLTGRIGSGSAPTTGPMVPGDFSKPAGPRLPPPTFDGTYDFSDEPPLLEELGVDLFRIWSKTLAVVNPFKAVDTRVMEAQDSDLAGPVIFVFLLGVALMFRAKLHFGYLFGVGFFGAFGLTNLFNLMAQERQITFFRTLSIVGYGMLPVLGLAVIAIVFSLTGWTGLVLGSLAVAWCVYTSTRFFEAALGMPNHRWLIAYPVFIFYACFVIMTVF